MTINASCVTLMIGAGVGLGWAGVGPGGAGVGQFGGWVGLG